MTCTVGPIQHNNGHKCNRVPGNLHNRLFYRVSHKMSVTYKNNFSYIMQLFGMTKYVSHFITNLVIKIIHVLSFQTTMLYGGSICFVCDGNVKNAPFFGRRVVMLALLVIH